MLFLQFSMGTEGFVLATDRIIEVVPLVALQPIRHAPAGVAGSFTYRGRFIPVVDLSALELGRPALRRLSTRIVVVRHPGDAMVFFGLIVERATEVLTFDPAAFTPFAVSPQGLVQRVEIEGLLDAPLLSYLSSALVTG
jgi:chemotaxis-related protein WspB